MRWFIRVSIVGVVVCGLTLVTASMAHAGKGGRGGGRGASVGRSSRASFSQRGPSSFSQRGPSNFSRTDSFGGKASTHSRGRPDFTRTSPTEGRGDLRGREWARERQRTVAERNLDKRKSQAEHLRNISERNGNERLLDTADRMEQRGQEQYERRIDKINSAYRDLDIPAPPDGGAGETVSAESFSPTTSPTTVPKKSKWNDRFADWWPFGRSGR